MLVEAFEAATWKSSEAHTPKKYLCRSLFRYQLHCLASSPQPEFQCLRFQGAAACARMPSRRALEWNASGLFGGEGRTSAKGLDFKGEFHSIAAACSLAVRENSRHHHEFAVPRVELIDFFVSEFNKRTLT